MRFSVITITYNAEKFLYKTLNSVALQDFQDFEHIVWDGGSQDATLDIVAQFPHIKMYQGKDRGISDAMNRGASYARGEFLLFLHADDLLAHKRAFAVVDTCLKLHGVDWLCAEADEIDASGEFLRKLSLPPVFSHKKLRRYNTVTHPATFISRHLFKASGGFNLDLHYCMDYDLWLRLARFSIPFLLPFSVASVRKHKGSISTREEVAVADEAYHVRNRYVTSLEERWRSYRTWKKRIKRIAI